jgi:hypothetical protein
MKHRDYVPDERTAIKIAEAVLIGQFGETKVAAQRPLVVDKSNKDYWIVQLVGPGPSSKGGGPAVWIDRNSGCLKVMDYMK